MNVIHVPTGTVGQLLYCEIHPPSPVDFHLILFFSISLTRVFCLLLIAIIYLASGPTNSVSVP